MTQQMRLDLTEGRRRRDVGKAQAAAKWAPWLASTREVAVRIARQKGTVTADDLRAAGIVEPPGASYNVWGSVFNDDRFVDNGFIRSKRPEAHANLLHEWRLA